MLVTGGAGFIGSSVVRRVIASGRAGVVNVDKLTYAASTEAVAEVASSPDYAFEQVDIVDADAVRAVFDRHRPTAVMHLAAESHVDRSIDGPGEFVSTNIVGTFVMLQEALRYWRGLPEGERSAFRFLHVSTDEVFGSLGDTGYFTESTPYDPSSPYSASKAAADHLARAWHRTFGLPVLLTNCSNNYGPYQFPEKMIPLMVLRALEGKPMPVYGRGENVRDWLYVDDHADALLRVLERGRIGETYLISGRSERRNIDVVTRIAAIVDELQPDPGGRPRTSLIAFVTDRPGHDHRYAIDATKIETELGWAPAHTFEAGLRRTVQWYIDNGGWRERVHSGVYRGERLGLAAT